MTTLHVGNATLILDRRRPFDPNTDPSVDRRLIRRIEARLGLPDGHLPRPAAMDRSEFRLLEGVDRPTAEAIAQDAILLGYTPRIHDGLGVAYSGPRMRRVSVSLMAVGLLSTAVLALTKDLADAYGMVELAGPLFAAMAVSWIVLPGIWAWLRQRSAMPLALSVGQLFLDPEASLAPSDPTPVDLASAEARRVLRLLSRAVDAEEVPVNAAADLRLSISDLTAQVDDLVARGAATPRPDHSSLDAVRERLASLDERAADATDTTTEADRLRTILSAEEAAVDRAAARTAEVVAGLAEIRRAAADALASLGPSTPDADPAARLRREAVALQRARQAATSGS